MSNNNDAQMKKMIIEQLRWDNRISECDIKVGVKNGEVTLIGEVPTYFAKKVARDDVAKVANYALLIDKLKVKSPKLIYDQKLKKNIESNLFWNLLINENDINVAVKNGIVTLGGTVLFYWQKEKAQENAEIDGVIDVINNIAIVPIRDLADEEIAADIVQALTRDPLVNEADIDVKVKDREVTLTGSIPSWAAFKSATDDVIYTWGVVGLKNDLKLNLTSKK